MSLVKDRTRLVTSETGPGELRNQPSRVYSARDLGDWYVLGVEHERERAAAAEYEAQTAWTRSGAEVSRSRYDEMMQLFEESAHRFHEQQLGKPYREFTGRAA